eukprot:jgi/Tetstr1/446646/TSEL_034167.t1
MLASTHYQDGGLGMWSRTSHGITSAPNFGRFMSFVRFHGIRFMLPCAKTDLPSVHKDGWAWFRQAVAEFSTNREAVLGVLRDATLDEYMSAWLPWTSKTGGLPNLSFITQAVSAGRQYVGVLKTANGGYPKNYITSIMDPMCDGDRLALTGVVDGVDLMTVGYKYNKKEVINFFATKGAAPKLDGDDPYKQRWLGARSRPARPLRGIARLVAELDGALPAPAAQVPISGKVHEMCVYPRRNSKIRQARCRICLDKHEE